MSQKIDLACVIRRDKQASIFVSHCPNLNLYSQGETEEEAIGAITSAVVLYFKALCAYNKPKPETRHPQDGFVENQVPLSLVVT